MAKLEDQGLPPYLTAYLWAAEIIREIGTHGWLLQQEIALPALQNKISIIRGSAESLVQLLRLQLPFIYVHLVSFTVHIYLIILATWFGFLFSVGFNRTDEAFASDENSAVSFSGDITDNDTSVKRLTGVFGYLFIIFANILFQGLLEIHAALDNPFGKEAFKIPIRLLVTDLMRATEAMIQDEATLGSVGIRNGDDVWCHASREHAVPGCPLVEPASVAAPSSGAVREELPQVPMTSGAMMPYGPL
eukprot:scaffold1620_cov420-Prasinococcus_capsulatus_cf.AAC.4